MPFADFNPITRLRTYLDGVHASAAPSLNNANQANHNPPAPLAPLNQLAPSPAPSGQGGAGAAALVPSEPNVTATVPGTPVEGTFIDAGQLTALIGNIVANTQNHRQIVESFDEDKEPFVEKGIRWFYMAIFYALPALVAYFVGRAIGDGFSGNHALDWNDGWNAFNHVISWAIEFSISGLVLAASIAARRIRSSNSEYLVPFVVLCFALVFFAVASGIAQFVLVEAHLNPRPGAEQMAAIFRVSAGPAVDICSLLFLSVMRFKSLKKFLEDQARKQEAIRATSQSEIALQSEQVKAALDMQQALSDLATKAERAKVWNELERMQGKSMIENARRNMQGDGGDTGYYRRSRY